MAGKIIHTPASAHQCSGKPIAELVKRGTHWQCDDCNQVWVVVEGAQYNESYSAWRKINGRNNEGRDL